MKQHILILFILFALFSESKSQAAFDWAKSFGSGAADDNCAITHDHIGNMYITGSFQGSVDFDPGPSVYSLTSNGSKDCFIMKMTQSGNLVWVVKVGGTGSEMPMKIVLDKNNDLLVTGIFQNTVDFNPGSATNNLSSKGGDDFFVLKLDTASNYIWAVSAGGSSYDDWSNSMCTDLSGNVYITGQFMGTVDFNPGAGTANLTSTSSSWDAFILKLTSNGIYTWAKRIGAASSDMGWEIVTDNAKNVYVNGMFQGTVDFDPNAGTSNSTSSGGYDVFTLKLDSAGNYRWHTKLGSSGADESRALILDGLGNLYLAGIFSATADFDPGTGTFLLPTYGGNDFFIQKLDTAGHFVWARAYGSTGDDGAYEIDIDNSGNISIAGYFSGTVEFENYLMTTKGSTDAFAYKLNPAGDFIWVKSFGGTSNECAYGIVDLNTDSPVIIGSFKLTADFNPGTGTYNLTSVGAEDCFVVKLSPCTPFETTDIRTACGSYSWINGSNYLSSTDTVAYTVYNGMVNGCDSIVHLDLTINQPSAGTDVQMACDSYMWIDGNTYTTSNNTATHTIVGGASNGCDSTVTLNLTVNSVDESVTVNAQTITANQIGAQYQWLDCNNGFLPISGEISESFIAINNGTYAVALTYNSCVDTSDCIPIIVVDLAEDTFKTDIQLFPNPTPGMTKIDLGKVYESAKIRIVDLYGRTIEDIRVTNTQIVDINLQGQDAIYYVYICSKINIAVLKLFKYSYSH